MLIPFSPSNKVKTNCLSSFDKLYFSPSDKVKTELLLYINLTIMFGLIFIMVLQNYMDDILSYVADLSPHPDIDIIDTIDTDGLPHPYSNELYSFLGG